MVLGGALGNFLDRIDMGYVVDMFEFIFVKFAVFNVGYIYHMQSNYVLHICYLTTPVAICMIRKKREAEDEYKLDYISVLTWQSKQI